MPFIENSPLDQWLSLEFPEPDLPIANQTRALCSAVRQPGLSAAGGRT